MLLKELNDEKKDLFANLMRSVIEIDGKTTDEEMSMFEDVCIELGMDVNDISNYDMSLESLLEKIKETCNRKELRTFAVEIISLVCVDKEIAEEESKAVEIMSSIFDISSDDIEKMFTFVKDLLDIQSDLDILINN